MTSLHSVAHGCAVSNANHYPSLEFCKKLTEIGFPKTEKICELFPEKYPKTQWNIGVNCAYSPSVMELIDKIYPKRSIAEMIKRWESQMGPNRMGEHTNISLPDFLANELIWLVENNYISFNK